MKIHILGICGTFMAGIAVLAKQAGHEVTGSDQNVYPPMSTQLSSLGIELFNGYEPQHIPNDVDTVIVGNVIKRGNPAMEYVLNEKIPFVSGPQWLAETLLKDRWVLAVSGTHGKTTTTSMLAWILEFAGLNPGFLIGGVPENFGVSARMGKQFFVIEADEYDCAFFDKRSKFIHYHPKTVILNNLEFDHADIFTDLSAIQQQFHYLIRTIPGNGLIVKNARDSNLDQVLDKGCWTNVTDFGGAAGKWQAKLLKPDGSEFDVLKQGVSLGKVSWNLLGNHNVNNALAAIAAASHAGVSPDTAIAALADFKNVKRRLEIRGNVQGITVYDDFAHHPTAIATTLSGLRAKIGSARLIAVLELGSYTMRSGVHKDHLQSALVDADVILCKKPDFKEWNLSDVLNQFSQPTRLHDNVEGLIDNLIQESKTGDHIVIMSNSGFGGIHEKLLTRLQQG